MSLSKEILTDDIIRSNLVLAEEVTPRFVEKCLSLCNQHELNSKELLNYIDAFLLDNSSLGLSFDTVEKLERKIIEETKSQEKIRMKNNGSTKDKKASTSGSFALGKRSMNSFSSPEVDSLLGDGYEYTPPAPIPYNSMNPSMPRESASASSSPGSTISTQSPVTVANSHGEINTYALRNNAGQSVVSLNGALGMRPQFIKSSAKPFGAHGRVTTNSADFENITTRYRFMFTSLEERARALDKHLLRVQEEMCKKYIISDLQPVGEDEMKPTP